MEHGRIELGEFEKEGVHSRPTPPSTPGLYIQARVTSRLADGPVPAGSTSTGGVRWLMSGLQQAVGSMMRGSGSPRSKRAGPVGSNLALPGMLATSKVKKMAWPATQVPLPHADFVSHPFAT